MKKKLMKCVGLLSLLAAATGCACYRAAALEPLSSNQAIFSDHSGGLSLRAKPFAAGECKRFLDRDVIAKGYQPVHITIQNDSDRSYLFSPRLVGAACAPGEEVAKAAHIGALEEADSWGIAGVFMWPYFVPAVLDGVQAAEANKKMDVDYVAKAAKEQVIGPHSALNGLLFVPSDTYKQDFLITLVDQQSHEAVPLSIHASDDDQSSYIRIVENE